LRPRSRALHRLRVRLGPRAPDHASLRHRRPAALLRWRSSLPEAILMNVPENWLKDFVKVGNVEGLARGLTMQGLEVESCNPVAPPLKGVVAGKVLTVEKHPNADKLTVCTVDTGKEKRKVVCGAPNVRVGMVAPLATLGSKTIRGVESNGMLCSEKDL